MDFTTWFHRWLSSHPLKAPPAAHRAAYTAEVMRRVSALREPSPMPAPRWRAWPRLALVPLAAAAVALLVVGRLHQPGGPLAKQITEDAVLLAAVGQPFLPEPDSESSVEELAQELALTDALVLAEAPPSDDAWIEQTLTLLEQLEEDLPEGASGEPSIDEWLDELRWLDEHDLATSS